MGPRDSLPATLRRKCASSCLQLRKLRLRKAKLLAQGTEEGFDSSLAGAKAHGHLVTVTLPYHRRTKNK